MNTLIAHGFIHAMRLVQSDLSEHGFELIQRLIGLGRGAVGSGPEPRLFRLLSNTADFLRGSRKE